MILEFVIPGTRGRNGGGEEAPAWSCCLQRAVQRERGMDGLGGRYSEKGRDQEGDE